MHSRTVRICLAVLLATCVSGVRAQPVAAPVPASFLSDAERQWVAAHPVVQVSSDAGSPPFDFLDAQGRREGLLADYLAEFSRLTGLVFEWDPQTRRDRLVGTAQDGDARLLAGFAVPVAADAPLVRVQRSFAVDYPVLVVRREVDGFGSTDGERQRVSLVRAYAPAQDYAATRSARQFLNSEGFETALVDVAVGRSDLTVQSLAVADYLIRERGLSNLVIAGAASAVPGAETAPDRSVHWVVPAAAAPLASILEKAWDQLPPDRHRALRDRWLAAPPQLAPATTPLLRTASGSAMPAVFAVLAALLGSLFGAAGAWALARWWRRGENADSQAAGESRVLANSPALVFEMEQTTAGNVVVRYASPAARRLFALAEDDEVLPLEAFLRTIHADDQPRVMSAVQQSAVERRETEQEYRVLSREGLRWIKSVVRPIEEPGRGVVWSGVTFDIGAQKRAEIKASQAEQRLREIADNVPGVVFQVQRDLGGGFTLNFASASLQAVRGVRPDDFNRDGDAFFNSVHDEDRGRLRDALELSATTLEAVDLEYRVRMGDGRVEWMSMRAVPTRVRDGVVVWNGYLGNLSRVKIAEERAERSKRFLNELTDGLPGFVYQLRRQSSDTAYVLSFVSAGVSAHGITAAEAQADIDALYAAIDPEDRQRLLAAIDRSYANLTPFRLDYRLRLPSGLTAWMRTQAAPIREADGAVVWNGMSFNSSEEKLREMQAKRAEERLSRLTNALPGMVFQLAVTPGGDWLYTHLSDGVRQLHQVEPEAVLRDAGTLHQMLFAEDWRRLEMALMESVNSGSEVLRECRMRRSDGALRWLAILARPQGNDGELFVWNGFTRDITEEKEAAIAADNLQRRLREVTENVPCTVFQLQRDFEDELSVRFVSENIYALLGIGREELLEDITRLVTRIVQDDLRLMFDALDTSQKEQRPVFFDFRVRDTAGALRWLRGSVSTPRVEDGGLLWSGAWLDISDIKELEMELAKASEIADGANRLKSEFLATMSHEIRTPMNAIIGLGQLMQHTPLSSTQRGYLEKINTASQSLLGILNDILDHSKIEAGKMSLERTEFDLNTVLDSLSAVTHLKAIEKDLELRFEVPPGLPMRLLGDPLRLGQVLVNLTSNAIKFSERGTVVLRVEEMARSGGEVRLVFEVEDEGIGLSEAQIENLFQSFAQADASTTRKYGGTGLGLSIARNLIRLMDGDISVVSTPGEGSTFRFEALVGLSGEPQPQYALPRDLYGLKALVVDDNAETRAVTEGWLVAFGFEVSAVDGGMAGLELLHEAGDGAGRFALVVLDWRMPGLNGVETAERIRKLPLKTQPALLMATAYVNDELVKQCDSIGLKDFVAKPFSPSALFNSVLSALGRAEMAAGGGDALLPLAGLRVLVADDNEVNLEIATGILETAGAILRLARDGEEVLDRLSSSEFDVALLDLEMPRLDGLETARRLRADPRFATLPLVAMTAHALPTDREAGAMAGFDAYLLKPIDRRELFDTLLRYRASAAPVTQPIHADAETLAIVLPPAAASPLVFDRHGALMRLGGNEALLERLLARFATDHGDAAQQIVQALKNGDIARATREAHTLKGVAANLGASLLAASAGSIEAELRRGGEVPEAALDVLRIQHQETLRAIAESSAAAAVPAARAPDESREALRGLAAQLHALLETHDADAKDAYEALQQRLPGAPLPSLLRLRAAVENYEFESAMAALQDVFRDLNLLEEEAAPK